MKKVMGFFRTFLQTLTIDSYTGFAESTIKNAFRYYCSLIFYIFVMLMILMIPSLVTLPNTVESYFDNNIAEFTASVDLKTSSPILIPKENPLIMINYANNTPIETANVIITNDVLYAGFLFKQFTKDVNFYRYPKINKTEFSNFLAVIILMMVPTLFLIFFFYMLIKYFAVIVAATLLGAIIAQIIRYKVEFKKIFNCAMYGISLTVLLDSIFFFIGYSFYFIQYLPLAIYVIAGIIQNGTKIDSRKKNKYYEIKG